MGLLSPITFLLLLPLGTAIIVLYLLKLKRKEKVVSSVFLWRHAIQDVQANAPFQKLRKNLLLFIQLAILIIVATALARPFARTIRLSGQNIVIIIDSSASMNATDLGKSRFDEAKRIAKSTIEHMGHNDSLLIIAASAKTKVVSSFTSNSKALSSAITSLEPRDTRANLREAIVLALSLVAKKKNPQIVVISDGGFASISDIRPGNAQINFIKVGKRSDNVGIVALDARKTLAGAQQVFVGLRNFSDHKQDMELEVWFNDQLIDSRNETLKKGETKQEILSNLPQADGRLTVKLNLKDDLQSDNTASVYLTPPKKLSVLLVTKGNMFLERAFNLNPRTEVVKGSEPPADLSKYNIAVFDGIRPPDNLPHGGYLLISTDCKAAPVKSAGSAASPSIVSWSKTHPATSYVDFADVRVKQSKILTVQNWGQELIECEKGPLAAAGESGGRRFVTLGWNLLDSDFPLRVGFPIFITNCIDWLSGSSDDIGNTAVRTGSIVPMSAPGQQKVEVIDPDGRSSEFQLSGDKAYFDNTERVGVYKIKTGNKTQELACNLLSPEESDITPRGNIRLGEREITAAATGIQTNREFWRMILLIGLALFAFEWYAFHRRLG
jgi:hypothetical protein